MGRRHRAALGDQVHRRARHQHRRRRRRRRHLRLVERPLSGDRRAVAGLSRPAVPRDVRHLRLPDEAAGRDAARPRRGDEPVQRLPVPAGARDAVAADGPARRQRAGRRRLPGRARPGHQRHLSRARHQPLRRAGRQVPAARRRRDLLLRMPGRARRRPGLHPRPDAVVAPRQRRRLEEPDHPSGQHHPPAVERRRAARRRRRARHHPALGRHRVDRRPALGSRAGLRQRARGGGRARRPRDDAAIQCAGRRPDPLPGSDRDPARAPSCADDRHRRPVAQRAARQLLRRLLPEAARLPRDPGQPARARGPRRAQLRQPGRRAGAGRHRQRLPRARRAARHRRGSGADRAPAACGASSA